MSKFLLADLAVPQVMWIRYVFFVAFAVILARRGGVVASLRSNRPWLQIGRATLGLIEGGIFVLAFRYLPLAETHAMGAASPLIVVALSFMMLGERVTRDRWMAVAGGFVGVLIILQPGGTLDWHLLIPLGGAFLWGLYQIILRLCARTDSSETTMLYSSITGLVLLCPFGLVDWVAPTAFSWFLLACIGILGSISHLALVNAMAATDAAATQPFSYTLLIWVAILGALVFGDIPGVWTFVGAGLVVASGLYDWHRERHPSRNKQEEANV